MKKKNRGVKIFGIFAISIVVLLVLFVPNEKAQKVEGQQSSFEITYDELTTTHYCTAQNGTDCIEFTQTSIIPTQPKLAESDNDVVTNFLESIIGIEDIIGIETVASKYNISGEIQTFSSIFPVQLFQTNILSEGFVVDNIQIGFNAITKEKASAINLEGLVEFKLDNTVVATKKLWVTSSVANQQNTPLKIVDMIPPPLDKRPETFDFTFTDEGFKTGDKPVFSVIIKSLKGTYQAGGGSIKNFEWNGEHIAYTLSLDVDESKTVVLNESGEKTSILKSDNKVVVCGTSGQSYTKSQTANRVIYRATNYAPDARPVLPVKVHDSGNNLVGELVSFQLEPKLTTCKTITGLQRNSNYTISVGSEKFPISTPSTQQNYNLQYSMVGGDIYFAGICNPTNCGNTLTGFTYQYKDWFLGGTSNFGYYFKGNAISGSGTPR